VTNNNPLYWIIIIYLCFVQSLPVLANAYVGFMSIAQFEAWSLLLCVSGLVAMMVFILYKLCKDSGAGMFGTFILFLALGMGIFGFAAKSVIRMFIDI